VFPFLIGTVRTMALQAEDFQKGQVSIPHRYGKNFQVFGLSRVVLQFPFLIGTVRTEFERWERNEDKVFPFLIGTVRTFPACSAPGTYGSFHSS